MNASTFLSHVAVAFLCGLVIGLERQWRQHPAGLRTNALISLGASLFASLAILFEQESSPTRVAGQIVTGIGFLGGGVILRDGMNVKGLTTAATIWCTGAIGTLAGCGYLAFAVISTACVLFLNVVLHPVSNWVDRLTLKAKKMDSRYQFLVGCTQKQSAEVRKRIVEYFQSHDKLLLQSIEQQDSRQGRVQIIAQFMAREDCHDLVEKLMSLLQLEHGVAETRWEKAS